MDTTYHRHHRMEIQSLGQYRLVRKIGAGGMGVVYLGWDERLDREVAIKILPAGSVANEEARNRFRKEAQILSKLNHPNIATIYDFNTTDGVDFLAMEFVDGATLSDHVGGQPQESEICAIAIQICEALEDAHGKGIVHCDLKPQNIMVSSKGRVKLLDFGVAALTRPVSPEASTASITSGVGGSLPYMSPEQLTGGFPRPAADVYGLGVVLYELATSQRPFQETQPVRLADAILHAEPLAPQKVNPQVSNGLQVIILKCLKKKPSERYESANAITTELRRLTADGKKQASLRATTTWKWTLGAFAAAVTMLLASVITVGMFQRQGQIHGIHSIAVLPLQNLSASKDQDYFVEGVTDELTSHLAQVGALQVVSLTSARAYKDSTKSVPQIAREMNVDAVVTGSVSRVGDRVRINAQLIDAATDRHIWVQSYERDLKDALALQSEVAAAIADAVNAKLSPREVQQLHDERRVDPEAYDYFLRGRQHAARENADDTQIAIELLEHSVATDPSFAEAHAELSSTYLKKLFYYAPSDETLKQKAFSEVETALRLNPELAEAHLAKGLLLWSPASRFAHADAISEYRHALRLKPSLDEAHHQLGLVYLHIGFPEESLKEAQIAVKLNPGNTLARYRAGVALLYSQRFQEAEEIFSGIASEFQPALVASQQAWTLSYLGRTKEAARVMQRYLNAHPDDPGGMGYGMAAEVAALQNKPQDARRYIALALKNRKGFGHFHHTAYDVAVAYALQGDPKLSVQWLRVAADDGFPCYSLFMQDQNLSRIRSSQEFKDFIAEQKTVHDKFALLFSGTS
jgi:serine/threonine protein kinase/tetratricopeptide (TPR) repeat protein